VYENHANSETDELKSICLTMVAAGLDTLPGNINMTIGYLSSPHGQEIQERMYKEIIDSHAGEDPWHGCLLEEKSEFVVSFVKVGSKRVVPRSATQLTPF
jgi:phenylacetate 2-hydroxylase